MQWKHSLKEDGSDRSVSNDNFSSVTLNKLATKARERYCNFLYFSKAVNPNTDINSMSE